MAKKRNTKSRTFTRQAAQGDLLITRIDALPKGLERVEPTGGYHIVAHSETGHHHTVGVLGVDYWREPGNPLRAYLTVEDGTTLQHHREFHTHAPIAIGKGTYELRRPRERAHTPEGWKRTVD
jgi:hypothetical protein